VQGISVENAGYIITVLHIADENISKGRIDHLTGAVRYEISFDALLFRPFKNEVMDALVTEVTEARGFDSFPVCRCTQLRPAAKLAVHAHLRLVHDCVLPVFCWLAFSPRGG
jgi:hypothetical protein